MASAHGPSAPHYILADGMDYAAVGQAVSRFGKRLQQGGQLRRNMAALERQL